MPGVDFRLLREQITMRDVLRHLQFEATVQRGDQWRGRVSANLWGNLVVWED
jgi:hypothetical protein